MIKVIESPDKTLSPVGHHITQAVSWLILIFFIVQKKNPTKLNKRSCHVQKLKIQGFFFGGITPTLSKVTAANRSQTPLLLKYRHGKTFLETARLYSQLFPLNICKIMSVSKGLASVVKTNMDDTDRTKQIN